GSFSTTSPAPPRSTAISTAGSSSIRGRSPRPTVRRAGGSEREKAWEGAGRRRPPPAGGGGAGGAAAARGAAPGGGVEGAAEREERGLSGPVLADDGDDRAGGQLEVDVVEHPARRARIGEGDALQADALGEPLGDRRVGALVEGGGVVLEPSQALRAVEPDAA